MTNSKGFTLIELIMIIVLLGILSATAVVLMGNVLTQQRTDETLKEMQELVNAMGGNPELVEGGARTSFGYAGDMGTLPPTTGACTSACGSCGLVELVNQCTRPSWTADAELPGTGYGWRGPYIDAKQDDSNRYLALLDGWGNYYTYNAATGQITSYGPDGASGGGDDIVWPGSALPSKGTAGGRVTDVSSNPISGNNVTVTHPNPASPGNSTTTTRTTDTNGFFNFTGASAIPIGRHKIQTTVVTQYTKSVTVLPNQSVTVDFSQTADTTPPNPVTAPSAQGVAPNQINLTWTAPSDADLAGYNIYRSTVNGFTPSTANLIATIGLATSYSDATIAFGTVYYYHIRPVDRAGNINTTSVQVSARGINGTGSIVQITPATVSTVGATTWVYQTILNNTGSAVTTRSARISWSGNPSDRYTIIDIGDGANEWTGSLASGTCAGNWNYSIASGSAVTFDVGFNFSVGTNNSIRVNLYTGNNCGGTEVAGNYTVL
jgi:hypothetical protein